MLYIKYSIKSNDTLMRTCHHDAHGGKL